MTAKEKYHQCQKWKPRVKIINLFHIFMCVRHKNWTMRKTAAYFNISLGAVSEAIKMCKYPELMKDTKTRTDMLLIIRETEKGIE